MTYEGHWLGDPERGANQRMAPDPEEIFCHECETSVGTSRYTICSDCKQPLCENCSNSVLMRGYKKLHEVVCNKCSKERKR